MAAALCCPLAASAQTDASQPVDVTSQFVVNPSFESNTDGWIANNLATQSNTSFTLKQGRIYLERWVAQGSAAGSASISQTLSDIPAGYYTLTAAAQNIQQNSADVQTGAVIFAGSATTDIAQAATYEVDFSTVGTTCAIGFRATNATGNWLAVDNFHLVYAHAEASLLADAVTAAQSVAKQDMQDSFARPLGEAIAHATTAAEADESAMREAAFNLAAAVKLARANATAFTALKRQLSTARTTLNRNMAAGSKARLQQAYDVANAIINEGSDADIESVAVALTEALAEANASYTAYTALNRDINTASRLNTDGKEGAEALADAIAAAQQVLNDDNATPEQLTAADVAMQKATLAYRLANPTGTTEPKATTLGVIQGSQIIFARGSFSSSNIKEKGFCYSTEPEPTVLDDCTSTTYTNNGEIYYIDNVKPATVYYVRAYAMTTGYRVAYGAVQKVATLPAGNVTWSYDYAGDNATNNRIVAAIEQAVTTWNKATGIRDFGLNVHYVPGAGAGGGTADCSYGGYMRISQNQPYQATGTVMHEGAHGLGVGTHWHWYNNAIYRENTTRGLWLGNRVDRVLRFLDNNPNATLTGDNTHMWPYGINGAQEDNHTQILYYANALILEALNEDNLPSPNHDFAIPAYTFVQDDAERYFIKSESEATGLKDSYLRVATGNRVRYVAMSTAEAIDNDSCAWTITYDPATCFYTLRNIATDRVLTLSGTAVSTSVSTSVNSRFQLMPARKQTTSEGFTFAGYGYWLVSPNSYNAILAGSNGAVSASSFNHANTAVTQRWMLLTTAEAVAYAEALGEDTAVRGLVQSSNEADIDARGGIGALEITSTGTSQAVNVYTTDGRTMARLHVAAGATAQLPLPKGIYIVRGSNSSQRVVVR